MTMMMLNTATQSAAAASRTSAPARPAQAAPDAGAQPNAAVQPDTGAQPFAAWLGERGQAAALALKAGVEADGAVEDDAAADDAGAAPAAAADEASAAALPQDGALLAAMAMPLMPLTPVQVAQAVQAAQPAGMQSGDQSGAQSGDADDAPAVAGIGSGSGSDGARRAAVLDRGQGLGLPQAPDGAAAKAARAAQPEAVPAVRFAAHAQDNAAGADAGAEQTGKGNAAAAVSPDRAAVAGAMPAQPAANAPATDTVKLAGPPTAWRQSLQEALGDRMQLQVGKGIEQAVIRLEPPQLGRIDIAIRHSAGALEVNISATNSEVLRQLQHVSDNLRSDLSQRQFTEVAVTVAPAPKSGAAPFGDQQQGRGRQQGREQDDNQPGRALAEAGNNSSAFSLGGRE
jgi:flagellar hook-length control protein FliK